MPRLKVFAERYAYEDLSKAIGKALIDRGMKKQDLAAAVKMSPQTISRWLQHPEVMSVAQLRSVVTAVGVDVLPVLMALGYREKDVRKVEVE